MGGVRTPQRGPMSPTGSDVSQEEVKNHVFLSLNCSSPIFFLFWRKKNQILTPCWGRENSFQLIKMSTWLEVFYCCSTLLTGPFTHYITYNFFKDGVRFGKSTQIFEIILQICNKFKKIEDRTPGNYSVIFRCIF